MNRIHPTGRACGISAHAINGEKIFMDGTVQPFTGQEIEIN